MQIFALFSVQLKNEQLWLVNISLNLSIVQGQTHFLKKKNTFPYTIL